MINHITSIFAKKECIRIDKNKNETLSKNESRILNYDRKSGNIRYFGIEWYEVIKQITKKMVFHRLINERFN